MAKKTPPAKEPPSPPSRCQNNHPADSAGQCREWGCPYSSLPKPE